MKTFIFGDSHTGIFSTKTITYSPGPITMRNFYSLENSFKKLIDQFQMQHSNPGDVVVLCLSEIDIRAHFWRDFPIFHSKGMSLKDFASMHAKKFISTCRDFYTKWQLGAMIIWGAPATSMDGKMYTPTFPFVGSPVTRNILCHELNMAIMREIVNSTAGFNIRFTSFFYNMVDSAFHTDTSFFHDGVHLDPRLTETCWNILEQTITNQPHVTVDARFHQLENVSCVLGLEEYSTADRLEGFDAWLDINTIVEIPQRQISLAVHGHSIDIGLFDAQAILRMSEPAIKLVLTIS